MLDMQGTLEGPRTTGFYVGLRKQRASAKAPQVRGDPDLLPLPSMEGPLLVLCVPSL